MEFCSNCAGDDVSNFAGAPYLKKVLYGTFKPDSPTDRLFWIEMSEALLPEIAALLYPQEWRGQVGCGFFGVNAFVLFNDETDLMMFKMRWM